MLKRNQIMGPGVRAALPGEEVHIRIIRQAIFGSSKESVEGSVSCGDSGVRFVYRVLGINFGVDVVAANSSSSQLLCKRIDCRKSLEAPIDVHILPSLFSPIHRF